MGAEDFFQRIQKLFRLDVGYSTMEISNWIAGVEVFKLGDCVAVTIG